MSTFASFTFRVVLGGLSTPKAGIRIPVGETALFYMVPFENSDPNSLDLTSYTTPLMGVLSAEGLVEPAEEYATLSSLGSLTIRTPPAYYTLYPGKPVRSTTFEMRGTVVMGRSRQRRPGSNALVIDVRYYVGGKHIPSSPKRITLQPFEVECNVKRGDRCRVAKGSFSRFDVSREPFLLPIEFTTNIQIQSVVNVTRPDLVELIFVARESATGKFTIIFGGLDTNDTDPSRLFITASSDLSDPDVKPLDGVYLANQVIEVVLLDEPRGLVCAPTRLAHARVANCTALTLPNSPPVYPPDFIWTNTFPPQLEPLPNITTDALGDVVTIPIRAHDIPLTPNITIWMNWIEPLQFQSALAAGPADLTFISARLWCFYDKTIPRNLVDCTIIRIGQSKPLLPSDFLAPVIVTPKGTYSSSPTPYVIMAGGNVTFSLPNTGSVPGVIIVTVPYSPAVGGGNVGTEYIPPNIMIELACDHTTRALRQTTTCHVTKNANSIDDFTSGDIDISWVGPNGTVSLGAPVDTALSIVDFDVTALVLEGVGKVRAVVSGDDRFKDWDLTVTTNLALNCPKSRMAAGQSMTCTISANTALIASDIKGGYSSKGALTFGTVTASAGQLSLPVTGTKGASPHQIAVLLPNNDHVLPLDLPIVEIVNIHCRPSVKNTRLLYNTRASCSYLKSATSADLLPTDISYAPSPNTMTLSTAIPGANGTLNFTYTADAFCGTAGCTLDVQYSTDLGGATVAAASNKFFVIDISSETHPSGRKARGFVEDAVFEKTANQPNLIPTDVAPVWSSSNFMVSGTPVVKSGIFWSSIVVDEVIEGRKSMIPETTISIIDVTLSCAGKTDPTLRILFGTVVSCVVPKTATSADLEANDIATPVVSASHATVTDFTSTLPNQFSFTYTVLDPPASGADSLLLYWGSGVTAGQLLAELRNVSFISAELVTDRQRVRQGVSVVGNIRRIPPSAPLLLSDFTNLAFSGAYAVINYTTYIASNATGNVNFTARATITGEGENFSVDYSSNVIGGGGAVPARHPSMSSMCVQLRLSLTIVDAVLNCVPRTIPGRLSFVNALQTTSGVDGFTFRVPVPSASQLASLNALGNATFANVSVVFNGDVLGKYASRASLIHFISATFSCNRTRARRFSIVPCRVTPRLGPMDPSDVALPTSNNTQVLKGLSVGPPSEPGIIIAEVNATTLVTNGPINALYQEIVGGGLIGRANLTVIDAAARCNLTRIAVGAAVECLAEGVAGSPPILISDLDFSGASVPGGAIQTGVPFVKSGNPTLIAVGVRAESAVPVAFKWSQSIGGGDLVQHLVDVVRAVLHCPERVRENIDVLCTLGRMAGAPPLLTTDFLPDAALPEDSATVLQPQPHVQQLGNVSLSIQPAGLRLGGIAISVHYNSSLHPASPHVDQSPSTVFLIAAVLSTNVTRVTVGAPVGVTLARKNGSEPLLPTDFEGIWFQNPGSGGSVSPTSALVPVETTSEFLKFLVRPTMPGEPVRLWANYSSIVGGGLVNDVNVIVLEATVSCSPIRVVIGAVITCLVSRTESSPALLASDLTVSVSPPTSLYWAASTIFVLTSVRCVVTRLTGSSEAVLSDLDPAAFILPTIPAGQIPYAEPSAVQALNANGTGIYVDVKGFGSLMTSLTRETT
eukprot:tig00020685_g12974.t1